MELKCQPTWKGETRDKRAQDLGTTLPQANATSTHGAEVHPPPNTSIQPRTSVPHGLRTQRQHQSLRVVRAVTSMEDDNALQVESFGEVLIEATGSEDASSSGGCVANVTDDSSMKLDGLKDVTLHDVRILNLGALRFPAFLGLHINTPSSHPARTHNTPVRCRALHHSQTHTRSAASSPSAVHGPIHVCTPLSLLCLAASGRHANHLLSDLEACFVQLREGTCEVAK